MGLSRREGERNRMIAEEKGEVEAEVTPAQPLTDEQRSQMELEKRGVLVRQVQKGPAAEAGIRTGDVILMINNKDVTDVAKFEAIVKDLPGNKMVPVLIQRRNSPVFLAMKVGDDD